MKLRVQKALMGEITRNWKNRDEIEVFRILN
jgi:hypothetical protein